jgi:hypothetical protein
MVDVEPSPVGQDRIDHRPLRVDHTESVVTKPAGVATGRLFLIGPLDLDPGARVAVDDERGGNSRIESDIVSHHDAVLGLGAEHLVHRHQRY